MNFPFYIARRYLFSKKSTNAINVISAISVVGVAVATMALVVTLSVFNGFHDLVATFFTAFDPQLKVVPVKGKSSATDDPILTQIRKLPQVDVVTECVEDNALAIYGEKQAMVTIKGVEDNFAELTHITDILYGDGEFELEAANLQYGTVGIRLASALGFGAHWKDYLKIYAPKREGQLDMTNPQDSFEEDSLLSPGVVFSVRQGKYDSNYIITPISFARNLFGQQGMVSSLEFRLKPGSNLNKVKKEMQQIAGTKFQVMFGARYKLKELRISKIDEVFCSLSHDENKQIVQVFLLEGRMISAIGAVIGILVGLLLCWLQQMFGIVSLGQSSGNFVIDAYPVSVHPWDILLILITVLAVGFISVWYPVRYLAKRLLE